MGKNAAVQSSAQTTPLTRYMTRNFDFSALNTISQCDADAYTSQIESSLRIPNGVGLIRTISYAYAIAPTK
jgi:hypothetical protein